MPAVNLLDTTVLYQAWDQRLQLSSGLCMDTENYQLGLGLRPERIKVEMHWNLGHKRKFVPKQTTPHPHPTTPTQTKKEGSFFIY